jgi:hypothetical protein|tara:strand:+ start:1772 stop:2176 length:405 start_codon:yes stop_codon:yes gene_type:complete
MRILALLFIVIGVSAHADSSSLNLQLPSTGGNYQSDKFRAGELDCSNAIGSATNLEFGVTGIIDKEYYDPQRDFTIGQQTDVGVFARITIPLGKRTKSRIDCNRLYELELRKKQLEVMKLEKELQQLRELKFED